MPATSSNPPQHLLHDDPSSSIALQPVSAVNNSSKDDPGPPPNGGTTAWMQAVAGHLVCINVWGYIVSFGVFQPTYVETLNLPPSTISWIGSVQLFFVYLVAAISGRLFDAGYLKPMMLVGCLLQVVGIFMTSICDQYWQFFLAQGVCMGLGFGLTFPPVISNVATYFSTRKTMAMAISATGGATVSFQASRPEMNSQADRDRAESSTPSLPSRCCPKSGSAGPSAPWASSCSSTPSSSF